MADCDSLRDAMSDLQDELREAERSELGHELKQGAGVATAGTGAAVIIACLVGWIGGPAGCAGAAYIAAGGGVVAGGLVTTGAAIHENQAQERREALERAYNDARQAYCACLRGEDESPAPVPTIPPAPPAPDWSELEEQEEELQQCMEEQEEAEAAVCEGPDPADQFPPSDEDEDDVDLVCYPEAPLYGPGF